MIGSKGLENIIEVTEKVWYGIVCVCVRERERERVFICGEIYKGDTHTHTHRERFKGQGGMVWMISGMGGASLG